METPEFQSLEHSLKTWVWKAFPDIDLARVFPDTCCVGIVSRREALLECDRSELIAAGYTEESVLWRGFLVFIAEYEGGIQTNEELIDVILIFVEECESRVSMQVLGPGPRKALHDWLVTSYTAQVAVAGDSEA